MWEVTKGTVQAIVRIFDPEQREQQISGVVGSYEITRQAIKFDTRRALAVLAVISLSLAIVNLFHSCCSTAATSSDHREGPRTPGAVRIMEQSGHIGFCW